MPRLVRAASSPGCLGDACRQHHDRALVEHDLQLETEFLDGFEHGSLVRLPGGDDTVSDRDRLDLPLDQPGNELRRRRRRQNGPLLRRRDVDHGAILGDHTVEHPEVGERALELRQLSTGDQDQPSTGLLQALQRRSGLFVHRAMVRDRAIIVRSQRQEEQWNLRVLSTRKLAAKTAALLDPAQMDQVGLRSIVHRCVGDRARGS